MQLLGGLTLLVVCQLAAALDPAFSETMTVYHVNPKQYGAVPANMDTADAPGDLFFDLHNVLIVPLECPHGAASGHSCTNPEASAPNLVVNEVVLEVDSRWGAYAKCNIGVNGTDGHGNTCKTGTYCCFCASASDPWGPPIPCNATLGRENVRDHFGSSSSGGRHGECGEQSPDYECFRSNAGKKFTNATPGYWFSSLEEYKCKDAAAAKRTNCTWLAKSVTKVITKACHNDKFFSVVEATNKSCFANCPGIVRGADAAAAAEAEGLLALGRNITSPCWIRCFYEAILGQDAGTPGGGATGGMALDDVIAAWKAPFEAAKKGGCEDVQPSLDA